MTEPDYSKKPIHILPQDSLLKELLMLYPKMIFKYHEHDTLLENKAEEELTEQEKLEAWAEFRREVANITKEDKEPIVDAEGNVSRFNSDNSIVGGLLGLHDSSFSDAANLIESPKTSKIEKNDEMSQIHQNSQSIQNLLESVRRRILDNLEAGPSSAMKKL